MIKITAIPAYNQYNTAENIVAAVAEPKPPYKTNLIMITLVLRVLLVLI